MIELLNIDCMEYMANCKDKQFDLAIVDPPYGINAHTFSPPSDSYRIKTHRSPSKRLNGGSGKLKNRLLNKSTIGWDDSIPDDKYFNELFRVSKNQIIWGGNYFPLKPSRCVICWDKLQPWENFSQWEMAWTSFDNPASIFKLSNTGGHQKYKKIHPTEKPYELYKWLLNKYSQQGDKILDTHLGSGSIAIACDEYGYDLVGCEIDKEYYDAAVKRYNQYKSQTKLF